jgi:hypothetical protein
MISVACIPNEGTITLHAVTRVFEVGKEHLVDPTHGVTQY